MYAIIADGSHQFHVQEGQVFGVETRRDLADDATTLEFDRILLLGDGSGSPRIGSPTVAGASVSATILERAKGDKIIIRKFRRRKKYSLKAGHRQQYLRIRIDSIKAP